MAIKTLAEVASVLKTQAQVGLKPGRGWRKAYRTGNLFNSVYVKIKSSSQTISGMFSIDSDLFYSKFIQDGGYGKVKYQAGPRPYAEKATESPEYISAIGEYIQSQFIPFFQKKIKKAQTDFNKVK